jgi:fibronectin type 3 domain-containing protein
VSLAGTPSTAATYSFTEKVTGCGGVVSQVSYKVTIQATPNHVVDLSWKASTSTDVVGYNVYRSLDGAIWKKINASLVASTLYNDSTVANSTTYYYAATAVDVYGHESSGSATVKAVVP